MIKKRNWKKIYYLFSKKMTLFLLIYISISLVVAFLISLISIKFSTIINTAIAGNIKDSLLNVIFTILLSFTWFLLSVTMNYFRNQIVKMFNINLRKKIDQKINNLDYQEFSQKSTSNYLSWYVNDISQLETQLLNPFFNGISSFIIVPISLLFILYKNYILFSFAFISGIFNIIIPLLFKKPLSKKNQNVSVGNEEYSQKTKDLLSGFFIFWSLNFFKTFKKKSQLNSEKIEETKFRLNHLINWSNWTMNFVGSASHCLFLGASGYLLYLKIISVGDIFAVLFLLDTLYNNLSIFCSSLTLIYGSQTILDKYQFNEHPNVSGLILKDFSTIQFKNVTFGYDENLILKNLNFKIEKGKKYALIGPSGIGKSTILRLLLGVYNNYEGEILINNISLKEINKDKWRDLFSIINQNPYLFADSITNNIVLWQNYDSEKFKKVVAETNLASLIQKNDFNYKPVKDDSVNISGGEKQKIAIARSLFLEKEILLLDEFTNALDIKNRKQIESLILNMDKTILHISHAIENNCNAYYDQIINLENLIN